MRDVLLVLAGSDDAKAVEGAFRFALTGPWRVVALQLLTSDLYHYGHNDLVATRPSKAQFLLYEREQVLERARAAAEELRRRAEELAVPLDLRPVETEDPFPVVMAEAGKGYEAIFIVKEKKKLFPLFKRSLGRCLRRRFPSAAMEC